MTKITAMMVRSAWLGLAFAAFAGLSGPRAADAAPAHSLKAFESQTQLEAYLKKLAKSQRPVALSMPMAAPPPAAPSFNSAETVTVSGARAASITNNQEAGVDEGDIVKLAGDYLVVLRRGRLFTVSVAGAGMRPVSSINAYPPGVNASGDWYDEMLVAGDRVVVIGYSYGRGGTQINRFHLDGSGRLSFEDAYQLRSADYYSSRNYASRLIGHRLLVYSMRPFYGEASLDVLPGVRRWDGKGQSPDFSRIGTAQQVFYSPALKDTQVDAVHSVIDCDLAAAVMACKSESFFGGQARVFYVSSQAVYIYSEDYGWAVKPGEKKAPVLLYRQPLDGSAPSAIGMRGMPQDQFSFQEDAAGKALNLVVTSEGQGDAMWAAERQAGSGLALARVPFALFNDGQAELPVRDYRLLTPLKETYDLHNRFVGNWLIYGSGSGWSGRERPETELVAVAVKGAGQFQFALPHSTDRIESLGGDAVVIGGDAKDLHFTTLLLGRDRADLGDAYVRKAATEAESRSHGFFFRPDGAKGDGMLGLPVAEPARPAYRQLFEESAAVVFLARRDHKLMPAGQLSADPAKAKEDHCVASCMDWYGNARPIFVGERVFALMGYELVEGRERGEAIHEVRRVNFAPSAEKQAAGE